MNKLKVLFLTNLQSPYRSVFFNELGQYVDLTVIYERKNASNRDLKWVGEKAESYKAIYLKSMEIGAESSLSFEIIKYLQDKRYNHVIISGYGTLTSKIAIAWLRIRRRKFIMNVDGGLIKDENHFKYYVKKYFISSATYWFSTGLETNKYLCHYGAKEDHCYIYPFTSIRKNDLINEVVSKEEKYEIRERLQIYDENVVLFVGQIIARKGVDTLVKACKRIKNKVGIYIVGGTIESVKGLIAETDIPSNIHAVGFKTKEEILDYYKMADVFVLPTREDIWGLVVNEAMSVGVPVITTTKCVAGKELIINDKNGYLIEPDNACLLAEKIDCLISDEEKRSKFAKNALVAMQRYTIENMAFSYYKYMGEMK